MHRPNDEPQLDHELEKVRADLRIVQKKDPRGEKADADCVAPRKPPVLLDPNKPLDP
jgi:hypothetical protein